jgi:endoglucanase
VHLDACLDQGGGSNVGGVFAGEWLAYSVEVARDDEYTLDFRLASPSGGGTLHVEFDGVDKTGAVVIPRTGGFQIWQTTSSKPIRLKAGRKVMRLVFDTTGRSVWACNLNWVEVRASAAQAAGAATRPASPIKPR